MTRSATRVANNLCHPTASLSGQARTYRLGMTDRRGLYSGPYTGINGMPRV